MNTEELRGALSAKEAALSQWLFDAGYSGLTDDQCACLLDPSRNEEANDMLDHIEARCGAPEHLTMAIRWAMHDLGNSNL